MSVNGTPAGVGYPASGAAAAAGPRQRPAGMPDSEFIDSLMEGIRSHYGAATRGDVQGGGGNGNGNGGGGGRGGQHHGAQAWADDPWLAQRQHSAPVGGTGGSSEGGGRSMSGELELLIEMLMSALGSGDLSEADQNKIIEFLLELLRRAREHGGDLAVEISQEVLQNLDRLEANGHGQELGGELGQLRQEAQATADAGAQPARGAQPGQGAQPSHGGDGVPA